MFQAEEYRNYSTLKVAASFKIIMTTSVTRPCFTTHDHLQVQDQDRFVRFETGLVQDRRSQTTSLVIAWKSPGLPVTFPYGHTDGFQSTSMANFLCESVKNHRSSFCIVTARDHDNEHCSVYSQVYCPLPMSP